jgi:ubiquitin-conjugating enzyme E2 D/E
MESKGKKKLTNELKNLQQKPIQGIIAQPINDNDITKWKGRVEGAKGTPFEGGYFHFKMIFPDTYPFEPPKVTIKTKIYHPNINSESGNICVNILEQKKWVPTNNIQNVLLSLQGLLSNPNPKSPLVGEINDVFVNDRKKYDETVREWVKKYASDPEYKE